MKQIICEMCGSNDFIKQDGIYVCQMCGAKYSVEDAKKLMVEVVGSIDVSGSTIKVDNTSFVQKSLENARRARAKEDWEECEKYYNLVEQNDPKNIEAIFYSSYGKAKMAMVDADRFKREQKINVLKKSISVIDDNYDSNPEKYEEQKLLIEQISEDLISLVYGKFVYNSNVNDFTKNDAGYTYEMFVQLCLEWIDSLENIINTISEPQKTVYLWKIIRKNYKFLSKDDYISYIDKTKETDEIISELDSSYQPEEVPKYEGCYVATCVYGSYDCPEVWTLRRFRDDKLAKKWYGRTFIYTYYAVSPTLVKWFGNTNWFKKMWRGKLDRFVYRLKKEGFSDTPYEDKNW